MASQFFPLMTPLISLLFHRKTITNRALIKSVKTGEIFRRKCNVGDLMYFWDKYRQKGMSLVGVGYVLETVEWNIDKIPRNIEDAIKETSPKKDLKWSNFAWDDGFDYYNMKDMYLKLKIKENDLESQLRQEFGEQTGKHAIWNGKITKNFINWKLFRSPNFVDYFSHHIKKNKNFKMFYFREAQKEEIPQEMYKKLIVRKV